MNFAFDVGGVLFKVDLNEFSKQVQEATGIEDAEPFLTGIQALSDVGLLTIEQALYHYFKLEADKISKLKDVWMNAVIPDAESINVVLALANDGHKIAILSNVGIEHAPLIKKAFNDIDCIYHLSCEVGARKPTKLYFDNFLSNYPCFKTALFIDDRHENIIAANKAGLNGVLYRTAVRDTTLLNIIRSSD